uniref:(northern house mosquito) hypothetical protein n=1 Tax=Culex pipiens TaxID=7175 RepID=A0A8D8H7G2_CULPI
MSPRRRTKKINRPKSRHRPRKRVLKLLILMPQQEVTRPSRPKQVRIPAPETRPRTRTPSRLRWSLSPRRTATRKCSTREICNRLQLLPWPRPPSRRNIWPPLRSAKSRVWSRCSLKRR